MADEAMSAAAAFVKESALGTRFLATDTWYTHVLTVALDDLQRFIPEDRATFPVVLDLGCGHGRSLCLLAERFRPERIVGVDADPRMPGWAAPFAADLKCETDLRVAGAHATGLPDASVDLVFCHQTLHHIVEQEAALAECFRVLRPGGLFLMAESTRKYIRSWMIRLFFRHPMEVQRSAEEYLAMVRAAGFVIPEASVSLPYLWWSRWDLGTFEWLGFPLPKRREETLVNAVALKP
ncbi:MAG TPA: methyltransferase domain-containing protein [Holophagaceae bacterium]|nr:methyltransferase domain-containing protein [Holophagaceae bacterium]